LERGKAQSLPKDENEKTGIEFVLKRLAGEASNKADGGGVLRKIKDFNAFLERAALSLEARKS